jgi:putative inorganic carbon (HCO3(-)) transporter
MSLILGKKLPDSIIYIFSIIVGFLSGAIILLDLPLKWEIAFILAISFTIILLIAREVNQVILFTLTLIIPFHIGTGLPAFFLHLNHVGSWTSLSVQFIDLLVILLVMFFLVQLATHKAKIHFFPYTTIPALAWLVIVILSAINASQVELTVLQIGNMAKLLLLYIIVAISLENEAGYKWVIWALLLGVLLQGLLGSYEWFAQHPLGLSFLGEATQLYHGRPLGTIGHPNGYALYLAATLPVAFALLFTNVRRLYKVLLCVVLLIGFTGLILSLSRGGWLAFGAAVIMVLVFGSRRKHQNLHISILGVASILILFLSLIYIQRELITDRLTSEQGQASALSRITMAKGAIAMVQDYSLLGVGANNYSLWMPKYDPFDFAKEGRVVIVHNIYLLVAAETGLLGLMAFLWFLASLFLQAYRLIRQATSDVIWAVGVSAFAAFTALSVHGMVDYDMLANETVFRVLWLFAAIVAGLSVHIGHEGGAENIPDYMKKGVSRNFPRES